MAQKNSFPKLWIVISSVILSAVALFTGHITDLAAAIQSITS